MSPEELELTELLAKKEQEWKSLQQRQVLTLQQSLKDAQKNLQEQKDKFDRLKKDFTHNFRVLRERDQELQQYEVMYNRLKVVENAKQSEISDLKIHIEKLQQEMQKERKKYDDLQSHYQRKLKEHQLDLERINSSKNSDIDHLREEYVKVKRELERKIEEVQGELTLQRQELSLEFDSEMKKREHEFRLSLDEMRTVVLSHELKVKLLTKELDVMRKTELESAESVKETELAYQKMQEVLKLKEFEMKELSAVKDARIRDLEDKLQSVQHQLKRQQEMFQRKHEQLDRLARERDSALGSMKEAHSEQVKQLQEHIKELQMCVETLRMEHQREQCNQQAMLGEKDNTIEKLKDEALTLKTGWDNYIAQVSKDTVNKDLQIQSLQEADEKLKAQITKYLKDIERYQQQLACSLEREHMFEQAKVQVELDWQKRWEQAENAQYQKYEKLIESLSKAKEQLEAELKERERRLNELQVLVSTLSWERDKSVIKTRKDVGQTDPGEQALEGILDFPSSEIQKLQEQNTELREVIGQMRKEMESLCEQISPPTMDAPENITSNDYVRSLESEIHELKQNNRMMEEKLQEALSAKEPHNLPSTAKPVSSDNIYIQNHISSLNETIGALRAASVASAATVKRLEARTAHLDSLVVELTNKVQLKQAEVSQLQFQLNSETRQSQVTISSLQQKQSELEMQLTEARKEAEEYFKGNLRQNLETVGLGNTVSALKLELASQRVPVVLSESETVKELRKEIMSLRQQLAALTCSGGGRADPHLQSKLKEAVKKISQLSLEKQQLIDMGNRLRAELAGEENVPKNVPQTPSFKLQAPQGRLSALESLQYELTSQELQFAQYQKPKAFNKQPIPVAKKRQHFDSSVGLTETQSSVLDTAIPAEKETIPHVLHMQSPSSVHSTASWKETDTSLQDVWKVLDMGSSPSLISSEEDHKRVIRPGDPTKTTSSSSPIKKSPEKSSRPMVTRLIKSSRNKSKVRNYNIRD